MTLAFILGLILSIAHYYSEEFCVKCNLFRTELISFAAGIGVTYIFVELLPTFSDLIGNSSNLLFLTILIGFVLVHLIEKYIYQHAGGKHAPKELALEDSIVSFIYHFMVGAFIVFFTKQSSIAGILFFIPILLHTSVSALPVDAPTSKNMKYIIASSSFLGVVVSYFAFTYIPLTVFTVLLGFIVGTLIFTTIRHSIPEGKAGKPMYFFIGVVLYTLIIYFTKGI